MKTRMTILAVSMSGLLMTTAQAKTDVTLSGYVKADAMLSSYSDGTLSSGNLGRDFYVPSLTPVGGSDEDTQYDAHIKQTRFRLTANSDLSNGEKITGVLELDFMATPNGDERISNSYSPRVRHAFIKYKNWLFGQTWSTFQDVRTLPESVDFIGVTDGTIFARQTMIRYSMGGLELAIENPETTVTPFGGGGRIVTDDNSVPDLVGRYTFKGDWGHIAVAGIMRQLAYVSGDVIDTTESAFGVSVTGKFNLGKDDIRVMVNSGSGIGRYLGLNIVNDAVMDASGELEAIDVTGYTVAYRHVWNDQWRSNFMYSAFSADNDVALTGTGITKKTSSARVNLMYSASKEMTFGIEYAHAKREAESGADGNMDRIQFTAKYAF